jgi:phage terminase Nu1 subunit (DNA packaging protein)
MATETTLLTKQELANRLGVTLQTITRYQREGMPVAFRLGGKWPRYKLEDCLAWINGREKDGWKKTK